jgi:hypothetical protein
VHLCRVMLLDHVVLLNIMQHTVPDTEGQMACNGPVGHPTDIIKTDANMHII